MKFEIVEDSNKNTNDVGHMKPAVEDIRNGFFENLIGGHFVIYSNNKEVPPCEVILTKAQAATVTGLWLAEKLEYCHNFAKKHKFKFSLQIL